MRRAAQDVKYPLASSVATRPENLRATPFVYLKGESQADKLNVRPILTVLKAHACKVQLRLEPKPNSIGKSPVFTIIEVMFPYPEGKPPSENPSLDPD